MITQVSAFVVLRCGRQEFTTPVIEATQNPEWIIEQLSKPEPEPEPEQQWEEEDLFVSYTFAPVDISSESVLSLMVLDATKEPAPPPAEAAVASRVATTVGGGGFGQLALATAAAAAPPPGPSEAAAAATAAGCIPLGVVELPITGGGLSVAKLFSAQGCWLSLQPLPGICPRPRGEIKLRCQTQAATSRNHDEEELARQATSAQNVTATPPLLHSFFTATAAAAGIPTYLFARLPAWLQRTTVMH